MADLYAILNTPEILEHLIKYWPKRFRSWQGRSLYYKDMAGLALLGDPATTPFWKVINTPGIEERLETFWPKEYNGKEVQSLFYTDITAVAYEFRVRWNLQRCELLAWHSPGWARWRMERLAGVRVVLGEGRAAITEALRNRAERVPKTPAHSRLERGIRFTEAPGRF